MTLRSYLKTNQCYNIKLFKGAPVSKNDLIYGVYGEVILPLKVDKLTGENIKACLLIKIY